MTSFLTLWTKRTAAVRITALPQPDRSSLYIDNGDVMQTAAVRTAAVWLYNYTNLVNIMLRKKSLVVDVRLTAQAHYIE